METPAPDSTRSHLPRRIGEYEIQRVLGSGGMATVYAALQKQPRRIVAVKVMRSTSDPNVALRRFRREIEILGRLRHPCIAQVFEAGVHDDGGGSVPFFVMEYVPGARLITEYAEQKDLPLRDRLKLFVKVCAAVEHGHRNKVIHRDLKPGNILVDSGGDPKIIDFGVARAVDLSVASQTMQTDAGSLLGTIQYMAPEQLEPKQDLDARCDVYALGAVLYKLLTGRAPYDLAGLPLFTAAEIIRGDDPKRPSLIVPELKGDLETIILKALAKDRTQRYRTAGSFGRDIVRFLADEPINARRASLLHRVRLLTRRRRREVLTGLAIALIAMVAAGIVLQQRLVLTRQRDAAAIAVTAPVAGAAGDIPAATNEPQDQLDAAEASASGTGFALSGLRAGPADLAFDPTGRFLAAGLPDHRLLMWNLAERRIAISSEDHEARVAHVAFTDDGSSLASVGVDGRIILIDAATSRIDGKVRRGCESPASLTVGETLLALGCSDLTLRVYHRGGELQRTLRGTRGAFTAVAFSRAGDLLAAGSERAGVWLFDVASGDLLRRMETPPGRIVATGFVAGGDHLAAVTSGGSIMRWALGHEEVDGEALPSIGGDIVDARFDPTGRWLICATSQEITIVDLVRFRIAGDPQRPGLEGGITAVAIGPTGQYAFGALDGTLRVESASATLTPR